MATRTGVPEGELIHHFRSRAALVEGLVDRELAQVDRSLTAAATQGQVARTWLRLSAPGGDLVELYQSMDVLLRALGAGASDLPDRLFAAVERWDGLLQAELGDPDRALLVRLVGDGLFLNAISGTPLPAERRAALTAALLGDLTAGTTDRGADPPQRADRPGARAARRRRGRPGRDGLTP